jgi:hypothetical protein
MGQVLLIGVGDSGSSSIAPGEVGSGVYVQWETIREQIDGIARELRGLFDVESDGAVLDTVAVQLGVTSSGEVGIIVSGATLAATPSITLTFARQTT